MEESEWTKMLLLITIKRNALKIRQHVATTVVIMMALVEVLLRSGTTQIKKGKLR